MVTIEKSCEMLASVDRVWELISDTDKDQEYWGAIRDIKVLKEGRQYDRARGDRRPARVRPKGKQTLVFDPKRSIELTMAGSRDGGERKIVLSRSGKDGTRVDVSWKSRSRTCPGSSRE